MTTARGRGTKERMSATDRMVEQIRVLARPLQNGVDLDPLMAMIGDARYVLLGEASHGTHEYYIWRYRLTRRLIEEKGFTFIAVEGDWPDCYRINRYVKVSPTRAGRHGRFCRRSSAGRRGCGRTGRSWRWPSGCGSGTDGIRRGHG